MLTKHNDFEYKYEMILYLHMICKWRLEVVTVKIASAGDEKQHFWLCESNPFTFDNCKSH